MNSSSVFGVQCTIRKKKPDLLQFGPNFPLLVYHSKREAVRTVTQ